MRSHKPEVETRRDALLDRFEARRKEIALRLIAAMRTEIGEYQALMGPGGSASPEFVREVLEHGLEHVDAFARTARTGEGPDLEFVRVRGEQRARQLLPLDALLQAYLLGQRVFWEALTEDASDDPDDLRALNDITTSTFRYTHAISAAVAETYTRVRQRAAADRDRARRDLLDTLLAGSGELPEEVARRAEQLGLDPGAAYTVAVAVPTEEAQLRMVAEAVSWHAASEPAAAFVVPRHDEVVALLPTAAAEVATALQRGIAHLRRTHRAGMRAGVGLGTTSLAGVATDYRQAHQALRHATAERPVVALASVPLFDHLTVTADPSSRHLVPEDVRRLAREPALVETLQVYSESDLNVAETARRLVVHPNTVHYRLGRVQQVASRDPRRFEDLVELLAGIRLLRGA